MAYDNYNRLGTTKEPIMLKLVTQRKEVEEYRKEIVSYIARREITDRALEDCEDQGIQNMRTPSIENITDRGQAFWACQSGAWPGNGAWQCVLACLAMAYKTPNMAPRPQIQEESRVLGDCGGHFRRKC